MQIWLAKTIKTGTCYFWTYLKSRSSKYIMQALGHGSLAVRALAQAEIKFMALQPFRFFLLHLHKLFDLFDEAVYNCADL